MPESISAIHPALIFIIGALLVSIFRGRLRQIIALTVPAIALVNYFLIKEGTLWTWTLLDFQLVLGKVDSWTLTLLNIFSVVSFCGILFIVRDNKALDLAAGLLYTGCAMGVVLAGDFITLFLFWEMLTIGAVMCLVARKTERSGAAAYRYLLMHVLGGVILLAGLMIYLSSTGGTNIEVGKIKLEGIGPWLIFIGFGVNCAWPIIGAWLTDTYPEASIGGIIFMATFTTKTAVYVLARTFPGEEYLIWIGFVMAILPLFYAAIENDLRRVLAYCLVNQVGFMVVGIGLGKNELALQGVMAHAYCHVLYKALLFMAIGAVIYRTGKSKATELGGLYKSMPVTCLFCIIGAASTSIPLFCGAVGKSMIISTAAKEHQIAWLALTFGSAGVFMLAGLKVTYFAFFGKDAGIRCKEAPYNQLFAMAIIAVMSVFIGAFPNSFLYPLLDIDYNPYKPAAIINKLSLLAFSALAFVLLIRSGFYPMSLRATNLDFDLFYRKSGRCTYKIFDYALNNINRLGAKYFVGGLIKSICRFFESAPAKIAILSMLPIWKAKGLNAEAVTVQKELIYRTVRRGAFPIGVTAFLAVVLLALLSIFSEIFSQ